MPDLPICLRAAREYYGVNTMNGEPDLSFLNYENAMSLVADVSDVQTIYYPHAKEQVLMRRERA